MAPIEFKTWVYCLAGINFVSGVAGLVSPDGVAEGFGVERGSLDALARSAILFFSNLLVLMSGLSCAAATQTNKKFQRDYCCVTATIYVAVTAHKLTQLVPAFGASTTVQAMAVDLIVNAPAFWFLFGDGFGKVSAPKGEPANTWFRKIFLWQATVCFAFGIMMLFFLDTIYCNYGAPEGIKISDAARALWGHCGIMMSITVPGAMCLLSGSASHKTRMIAIYSALTFSVGFAGYIRWGYEEGLLFPDHAAALRAEGFPEHPAMSNLPADLLTGVLPYVAALVLELTNKDKSE